MALRAAELAAPAIAFELPKSLEARTPPEERGDGRDDVRLLVTRGREGTSEDARFLDLPSLLRAGDIVVLNASATVPSSLRAGGPLGQTFTLNISTRGKDGWCIVEARGATVHPLETATLPGGARVTFVAPHRGSARLWQARIDGARDLVGYLYAHASPIAYPHVDRQWPIEAYQNVYATEVGSAEMPSAGRPFTKRMIARLAEEGIAVTTILLHTGVSSPERDEPPYAEYFKIAGDAAGAIERARRSGGRVIAVGTTVVRALESAVDERGRVRPSRGWTDLVIAPHTALRAVDGLITGFHEPRSTHLAMLVALAGAQAVQRSYAHAVAAGYLWHEFGDSHLIVP